MFVGLLLLIGRTAGSHGTEQRPAATMPWYERVELNLAGKLFTSSSGRSRAK
jgi:hypothetical protein